MTNLRESTQLPIVEGAYLRFIDDELLEQTEARTGRRTKPAPVVASTTCDSIDDLLYVFTAFDNQNATTATSRPAIYACVSTPKQGVLCGDANLWKLVEPVRYSSLPGDDKFYLLCSPENFGSWPASSLREAFPESTSEVVAIPLAKSEQPSSGHPSIRNLLIELRQVSGLSWEQIGELAGVSRRSIHSWLNDGHTSAPHLSRLGNLIATLRFIDRGTAEENRAAIFCLSKDGKTIFALLKAADFEAVKKLAGQGPGLGKRRRPSGIVDPSIYALGLHLSSSESGDGEEPRIVTHGVPKRLKLHRR